MRWIEAHGGLLWPLGQSLETPGTKARERKNTDVSTYDFHLVELTKPNLVDTWRECRHIAVVLE